MINKLFLIWIFCAGLCAASVATPVSTLTGRASNLSSYFFGGQGLRHNRLQLFLNQKAHFSDRLLSVVEVRGRFDPGAIDLDPRVKDDEMLEGEIRQAYLDYLADFARFKVGLQYVDWLESLSPYALEILTPLDLRHGAFGPLEDVLLPVPALSVNHKLGPGSLEWIVVPLGRGNRLPSADNGYGHAEQLSALASGANVTLGVSPIPKSFAEVEFGARYLISSEPWEFSILGYRGHKRNPAFLVQPTGPGQVTVTESFPRVTTLGAYAAYSSEAWIAKFHALFQPSHEASVVVTGSPAVEETLLRVGAGFDYVFSKHFKLYSELWSTFRNASTSDNDFLGTIRLTNETWKDLLLALTLSVTQPDFSLLASPEVEWTIDDSFRLTVGARISQSDSSQALLSALSRTDQVYALLTYYFKLR